MAKEQLDRNEALVPLACLRENVIKLHTEHQVPQSFVDGVIEAIEGLYDNMKRQLEAHSQAHEESIKRLVEIGHSYEADRLDLLQSTMQLAQTIDKVERELPPVKDVHLLSHDGAIEVIREISDIIFATKGTDLKTVLMRGDGEIH